MGDSFRRDGTNLVLALYVAGCASCACSASGGTDAGGCANGGADQATLEAWCLRVNNAIWCEGPPGCTGGFHQECFDRSQPGCRTFAVARACTVRLDPDSAQQCVLDARPGETCWYSLRSRACQRAVTPLGRLGDPCSNDLGDWELGFWGIGVTGCAEGFCDHADQCPGTCRPYAAQGDDCVVEESRCEPGAASCETGLNTPDDAGILRGHCRSFLVEGERCFWASADRPSGICDPRTLYCPWPEVDGGTCKRYAAEHEPCSASSGCQDPLRCSAPTNGTCEQPPALGERCDRDRPCAFPGQTCGLSSGRCEAAPLARGSRCLISDVFFDACHPSGRCVAIDGGVDGGAVTEGTCEARPGVGEACSLSPFLSCDAPYRCVADPDAGARCRALTLPLGEHCDPALDLCAAWTRCDATTQQCASLVTDYAQLGDACGACDALLECSPSQRCRPVCSPGFPDAGRD